MKRQTLVLDINELYEVIPEAKVLEGKNFKDVRELLKKLIAAIEENGQWEFIQHVQNKPSLFVIRETLTPPAPQAFVQEVTKEQIKILEERLNTFSGALQTITLAKGLSVEKLQDTVAEVVEQAKTSVYDNDFYKKDLGEEKSPKEGKLPWERI